MDNHINHLEQLKCQIRPYLKDFLIEQGQKISDSNMLRCINPAHDDSNPSMKLLADLNNEQLFCYGCHCRADIFQANHWLTGAPIIGIGFIKENVEALASRYGIKYEPIELTKEATERLDLLRLNKIVSDILIQKDERGNPINWTLEHAEERGWPVSTCEALHISTIIDYKKFISTVQRNSGLTFEELKNYDISSKLFGPDKISITIFDERGNPVGFIARNLKWKKGSKEPKYFNTSTNPLFHKGSVLYGMHIARRATDRRLDVFEGNGSFIVAYANGHKSCVSLMGSMISEAQINLIKKLGFTHVNFILDNDDTGIAKTEECMNKFAHIEGIKISYSKLEFKKGDKGNDPDDFIRLYGLSELYKLKTISSFEHFLSEKAELARTGQIDKTKFISHMIGIIRNTANRIERGDQIKALAKATEVNEDDIRDEIKRIEDESVVTIKKDLIHKLEKAKDTQEIIYTLEDTKNSIDKIGSTLGEKFDLSEVECVTAFKNLVSTIKNRTPGIQGWKTGYSLLDRRLSGIPKPVGLNENGQNIRVPGTLFAIAGAPQHSKSTVLQNLALYLAANNDDIKVLLWSLDDSRERTLERMVSMHSGVDWNVVTRRTEPTPEEEEKIESSINYLLSLMSSGKLIIKDQSFGNTIPDIRRWVEYVQRKSDTPICLCIDGFHKIAPSGSEMGMSGYALTTSHSSNLKTMAQTHCISIIATLEINKGARTVGVEPDLTAISLTGKIEFDFDIIAVVYNHYQDTGGQSKAYITDSQGFIHKLIKFNIRKSKEGGEGPLYFTQHPRNFNIRFYSMEQIMEMTGAEESASVKSDNVVIEPPDVGNLRFSEPWNN